MLFASPLAMGAYDSRRRVRLIVFLLAGLVLLHLLGLWFEAELLSKARAWRQLVEACGQGLGGPWTPECDSLPAEAKWGEAVAMQLNGASLFWPMFGAMGFCVRRWWSHIVGSNRIPS